jgi:restriction endonuclease S subunit
MLNNQVTTAQPNISLTNVKHFLVPVPPEAEQKRIVSKVTELMSLLDRLESTLTHRETTRTQLLTAAIHSILDQ